LGNLRTPLLSTKMNSWQLRFAQKAKSPSVVLRLFSSFFQLSLIGPSFPRHASEFRKGGPLAEFCFRRHGNASDFSMFQLEHARVFLHRLAQSCVTAANRA
jgi:hypothetical protein